MSDKLPAAPAAPPLPPPDGLYIDDEGDVFEVKSGLFTWVRLDGEWSPTDVTNWVLWKNYWSGPFTPFMEQPPNAAVVEKKAKLRASLIPWAVFEEAGSLFRDWLRGVQTNDLALARLAAGDYAVTYAEAIVPCMEFGLTKYPEHGWTSLQAGDYADAACRHALEMELHEEDAPDSGLPHRHHIAACLSIWLCLSELAKESEE